MVSHPQPALTEEILVADWTGQVPLREWSTRIDEPLRNEWKRVVNDTKTAANSLANSFLPEELRPSLF